MKKYYILVIMLFASLLIGCGNKEKQQPAAAAPAEQKPDNRELIAKCDSIIAKYSKSHKVDETKYAEFHKFLHDVNTASLSYGESINLDLTGTGTTGLITNSISFIGNGALIESAAYATGKEPLFKGRIRINAVYKNVTGFCESLDMYTDLLPYSLLFEAYRMRVRAQDQPFGKKTGEAAKAQFLTDKKAELEKLHLDAADITRQLNEYSAYLASYKGKFICNLSTDAPDTYFFDNKSQKFEIYVHAK